MIQCPDFLPLGSVVVLRGNEKKMLIVGRALVFDKDDGTKEYYDYTFVPYPEGLIRDVVIYSNHDCIERVEFEGYRDDDDAKIIETLQEVLPKVDIPKATPKPVDAW
jgi:hypothetical protein